MQLLQEILLKPKILHKKNGLTDDYCFELDVSSPSSADECMLKIINRFNKVDVLVNNAYFTSTTPYGSFSPQDWNESIQEQWSRLIIVSKPYCPI